MIGFLRAMLVLMALFNTMRIITMQTIINVLALSSFAISASVVGGGAYLYLNKDAIIENVKEQVVNAATGAISDSLPDLMDGAAPELPATTGNVIPPMTGGVALP
jgi:hypothetical protein